MPSYRTTLDATGPLSANKDLLYRFTMSYENDGSFQTYGYNRNQMFNPVVKWNIDANTWIRVSNQYQENNLDQLFSQMPYYNNVIPLWLGRSFNYGAPSPLKQQQDFAEVTWHHDFNKDWSIQQTAFMQIANITSPITLQSRSRIASLRAALALARRATVTLNAYPYPTHNKQAEYATVVDITGHFNTGELKHTLLLGADYYRYNGRGTQSDVATERRVGQPLRCPRVNSQLRPPASTPPTPPTNRPITSAPMSRIRSSCPMASRCSRAARYQYINSRLEADDPTNFCGPFAGPTFSGYGIPCNFDTETLHAKRSTRESPLAPPLLWRPLEWVSFYGNYVESYSPNYNGLLVSARTSRIRRAPASRRKAV